MVTARQHSFHSCHVKHVPQNKLHKAPDFVSQAGQYTETYAILPLFFMIMNLTLKELTKDISKIDFNDILSCWQWLIKDMKAATAVSVIGDVFFIGNDMGVYWMQTDTGTLSKIAANQEQFGTLLADEATVDNWFLPGLVEQLLHADKTLKENQVYSYKVHPAIGGDYSVENIAPTDISVHFAFAGQICEQIQNLPDGTKVNITFQKG